MANSIHIAKSEWDVFWSYAKLRFAFFIKEESKLFLGLLFFSQLIYTIILLVQMKDGADDVMFDLSMIVLPFLWTYTTSAIFSKERSSSRSILTLTTPINPYHRFSINALFAILLFPFITYMITRLLYALNLSLATLLVPEQISYMNSSNGVLRTIPSVYRTMTLKEWYKVLFPQITTTFTWFLPTTFFFMMATILRKHVFFKTIGIIWIFNTFFVILIMIFTLTNIVSEDFWKSLEPHLANIVQFYIDYPFLYHAFGVALGFVFLTIAYFKIKKFKTI